MRLAVRTRLNTAANDSRLAPLRVATRAAAVRSNESVRPAGSSVVNEDRP